MNIIFLRYGETIDNVKGLLSYKERWNRNIK